MQNDSFETKNPKSNLRMKGISNQSEINRSLLHIDTNEDESVEPCWLKDDNDGMTPTIHHC
jgi:hypothetical protein